MRQAVVNTAKAFQPRGGAWRGGVYLSSVRESERWEGQPCIPGLARKFRFAAWLLYWAWLQLGANDCLICSALQVISFIQSGQLWAEVAAGKSIRSRDIREVRLRLWGVHVRQSLGIVGNEGEKEWLQWGNESQGVFSFSLHHESAQFGICAAHRTGQEWIMGDCPRAKPCRRSSQQMVWLWVPHDFVGVLKCAHEPLHTREKTDSTKRLKDSWKGSAVCPRS